MYDFTPLKKKTEETVAWLVGEVASIRTGRATPRLLDQVRVDSYGTSMPLNQIGTVTVEDARTLRIAPWDLSQLKVVEKALTDANLGVSVGSDEKGVRVFFPELSSERREQLVKLVKAKLEDARVALRQHRDGVWNDIQKSEREAGLSEDEKFRAKEMMEKLIQEGNKQLDDVARRKEDELRS